MKSVGEVMAIGRSFEEALQKALRMLEIGVDGLVANEELPLGDLEESLRNPTDERILHVPLALRAGYSIERMHELTHIDRWFLQKIAHVLAVEDRLAVYAHGACPRGVLEEAKKAGFSDKQVARILAAGRGGRARHAAQLRPRAPSEADRHAGRRVSRADELPLPHLQRHHERRLSSLEEDGHRAWLGRLSHRQLGGVRLVLRERGHDPAPARATRPSSSTTTPRR